MKRKLNLKHPTLFSEKLMWLKLYSDHEFMSQCSDKVLIKELLIKNGFERYVIKNLAVYEQAKDIDFKALPQQFAMKTNHGYATNIICFNKDELDQKKARQKMARFMRKDYSIAASGAEIQYRNIKRKILVEPLLLENGELPDDLKVYCINGEPVATMVCQNRDAETGKATKYLVDPAWNLLRINSDGKKAPPDFKLVPPPNLSELYQLARALSTGIPFVRVDFYILNNVLYFGELTFTPSAGVSKNLNEVDRAWGERLVLPEKDAKYLDTWIKVK
jgi:hypothetical protein